MPEVPVDCPHPSTPHIISEEDIPYANFDSSGGRGRTKKRRIVFTLFAVAVALAGIALFVNYACFIRSKEVPAPNMPAAFRVGVYSASIWDETKCVMYGLYVPPHFSNQTGPFPLIVYLHGYGDRTEYKFLKIGLPGSIKARVDKRSLDETVSESPFNFVAFFPIDPTGAWAAESLEVQRVMEALDDVIQRHNIDPKRIYLTGLSNGGNGVWSLAQAYPDKWAALAPLSAIKPPDPMKVRHIPVMIFQGAKDTLAPVERARNLVDQLKKVGAKVEYREFPNEGHIIQRSVYDANDELFDWFAMQKKGD